MSQEKAKQQAWETYRKTKDEIDEKVKEACAPYKKDMDDDLKWAMEIENKAWNTYHEAAAEIEAEHKPDIDRATRIYHEALADIANAEEKKEAEDLNQTPNQTAKTGVK